MRPCVPLASILSTLAPTDLPRGVISIQRFSEAHPDDPIRPREYLSAIKGRMREQRNMDEEGNVQNPRRPASGEKGRFANVE